MDEAQARKLLLFGDSGTNVLPPGTMPSTAAAQASFGVGGKPATFEERNYRGLPIDTSEGAAGMTIVGAEWRDKPEQKVIYLEGVYGKGNVRLADDGTPLIKVVGKDNKPKEVPLSAKGLQFADVASFSAYIPETIGAILAMRSGRRLPFIGKTGEAAESGAGARLLGFGRDVTAEAVGQEAGGTAKDAGINLLDEGSADVGEIASERAGRIPTDMAVAAGMGTAGKLLGKVITPTGGARSAMEAEMQQARQYFKDAYGIDFPLTAGEKTGSSIIKRTEATMQRLPGSSGAFADIRAEKTDRLRRIMNRIMGLPEEVSTAERAAMSSEEQIGAKAVAAIRQQIDPVQRAVEISKNQVAKEANEKIMAELESATMADRQLYPEKVGESIRSKAIELRGQFQEESSKLYQDAYALPGGSDRVLAVPSLPNAARKLLDALPSRETITETPSPITGSRGETITKTTKGREVLKEFVPANVAGKLQALADLEGQKFSLQDLVAMRTDVANDIAQGEAIPGVQTHYLGKIRDTLTSTINEATDSLPDGNLKASWQKANQFYKENVGRFHEGPIARLFKDIESRGFVANEDIIRNIGSTEYEAFKKFLGPTSPEFTKLKRGIVDQLVQGATLPGEELMSGKAFIKELSGFYKKNRAIADDIFGTTTPTSFIHNVPQSRVVNLQRLGELLNNEDALIDPVKFRDIAKSGEPLGDAVARLAKDQEKLTKTYRSQIVKDIAEKRLGDSFDSAEFVNRFYSQSSPEELKSVISQLQDNPLTLEDLRRKVVEKTLYDAQRAIKDTDPSGLGRGELFRPSGSKQMDKVFGNDLQRERLQIMLGNRTYNDLVNLSQLLRAGEVTEAAFASAGGLSAGMQVANMLRGGVFSYAADWAKQKVAAMALTAPVFRQWLGNTKEEPFWGFGKYKIGMSRSDQVAMTRAFIASTPFVEAVDREFSSEQGTEEFIGALQRSLNTYEKYGGNTGSPPESASTKEERARSLLRENAPKVQPIPARP